MKIVITGGCGFIGSHLVKRLKKTHQVSIIDIVHTNPIDILDLDKLKSEFERIKPDLIIHLAAKVGVRESIKDLKSYIDTNITGTYNVLESCRLSGCKKLIFASSSSVYGLNEPPFFEEMPTNTTLSPYAMTKVAGEQLCYNFSNLYDMNIICLRLFSVYGPNQRPDLAIHKFVDAIYKGIPIKKFGDGSSSRDYTHIDDIVDGFDKTTHYIKNKKFDIFNLGSGKSTNLFSLISIIENTLNKKAIIEQYSDQKEDVLHTLADTSKSFLAFDYSAKVLIEKGVCDFVDKYFCHVAESC